MSDYIVLKKQFCTHAEVALFNCGACHGLGYVLIQIDLEEAIKELLSWNSELSFKIRSITEEPRFK